MNKYPSTKHFVFSPEIHADDNVISMKHTGKFVGQRIIITEKMDGENSCLKPHTGVFARSHEMPAMNEWLKSHYHQKLHILNPKYHYFGENMYGIHTIEYSELTSFFYVFNIFDTELNK